MKPTVLTMVSSLAMSCFWTAVFAQGQVCAGPEPGRVEIPAKTYVRTNYPILPASQDPDAIMTHPEWKSGRVTW